MCRLTPIIVFILSCIPLLSGNIVNAAPLIIIHIIMAIMCVSAIFSKNSYPFSLFKILNIFYLFFFCIAPIVQYNNNIQFLDTHFSLNDYIITSITALGVLILTHFVYHKSLKYYQIANVNKNLIHHTKDIKVLSLTKEISLITISASICLYVLYTNNFNIVSLIFRGGNLDSRVDQSQIMFLINENFLRPITLVIFLSSLILEVRHKITIPIFFLLLLITIPPTGVARLLAAAVYIPVVLFTIPVLRKNNNFVLLFCFGILVVFPLLNIFRHYSEHLSFDITSCFSQFEDLHFDAYSMMMRVIKDDIVTYGNQILGALFFWIPRSVWPSKPVGSGYFVAEQTELSFNNISMPFWGEGYINFGYFGVALFTIVLAVFVARTDSKFWNITVKQEQNLDTILYYLLLGLLMFVLRGDMMSGIAYTCGIVCSYYFIKKIVL